MILQPQPTAAKVQTLTSFGKLEVYCQSSLCIKMLKAQHDGVEFDADGEPEQDEVPAAPAPDQIVKDEAGASSSAGKKRVALEIDLTNDDSDSDSDDDNEGAAAASAAADEAIKRAKTSSSSGDIDLDFTK